MTMIRYNGELPWYF